LSSFEFADKGNGSSEPEPPGTYRQHVGKVSPSSLDAPHRIPPTAHPISRR